MRQQINLYQPVFTSERKLFNTGTVAAALAIVIACLGAYTTHERMQLRQLESEVEVLRTEQQERLAQAAQSEEAEARGTPADVESRINELSRSIAARTHALHMLQSGAAGRTTGFAGRLEALARRHVDGLWIDAVLLSGANGSMSIAGATLDADIVPRYLQNLARDSVLKGTRFDDFFIMRPQPENEAASETLIKEDGTEVAAPKQAAPKHIRFRAGSRDMYPDSPEATS